MTTAIDKYTKDGCTTDDKHKVCRSRGGESCAFDGAMIVLQPIADAAHIVHGPIACCGNSWEGRGTLSRQGDLHRRGFTTDMSEIDIVYGSGEKLRRAIARTWYAVRPAAIFVHATCVSGLIGEDIDAVCRRAEAELGIRVIPVNAPGFAGPKNLGNRIAGEVLLEHVIGTGEPSVTTHHDINLIGEYNIAGDLWEVEPLLERAGIRILSRITGDATFREITHAHRAKLNVVVCGRALINVAAGMERKYGVPFIEVSFYGRRETTNALRRIAERLQGSADAPIVRAMEEVIRREERRLTAALEPYRHLRGRRAVLYTGGVKSWSFISALRDLGIDVVAVGTRKSTFEDEEKMKEILGPGAPLVEDVTPGNLKKLLAERKADILVAGGRNRYLAAKEGYPFVDVNQERHTAYAGYQGLVNLAEQISNSMGFYKKEPGAGDQKSGKKNERQKISFPAKSDILIDPLKHSPAIGAVMAFQGVHRAIPVLHGAQGCSFLGKVLLTGHFREPVALATSKLFVEDVVMGSEENLAGTVEGLMEKNHPEVVGIVTTGLSEVKGDDVAAVVKNLQTSAIGKGAATRIIPVPAPDYDGGLETGYARAVESLLSLAAQGDPTPAAGKINVLIGSHLTPGDVTELRDCIESFGLKPIILPDLSALDGSRTGFSPLAEGGTKAADIRAMAGSACTLAIGKSMEPAAQMLKAACGVEYRALESITGLGDSDLLMEVLARASGNPVPHRYERQRKILIDGMRDAQDAFGGRRVCLALEPDLAVQVSRFLAEMGARVDLAVIPALSPAAGLIEAERVEIGGLFSVTGTFDMLVASSHGRDTAQRIGAPLLQLGFPLTRVVGGTARVTVGYRGSLAMINEAGNLLMKGH
jgi:nitrogenase molybdenum-iron cofactor biosynthesis protein NifE/nitrogenase molybdenum-iron cofactor biosynthesis protein NifN